MIEKAKSYWKVFEKWVEQQKWMLLGLCVLFICQSALVDLILEYICPITSKVASDSIWVLLISVGIVCICYIVSLKYYLKERELYVSRYWTMILIGIGYLLFRLNDQIEYYGLDGWPICYIDCAWIVAVLFEICLFVYRKSKLNRQMQKENIVKPFIMDTPCQEDEMERGRYVETLVAKIMASVPHEETESAEQMNGAFCILLNEHYGAGKTSFMLQVQKKAEERGVDVCWLKPWLYTENDTLPVNLIRVIREKLGGGDRPLIKMLDQYANVLSTIEKLEWMSILRQESPSPVETQFEEIKVKLLERKHPIVVLIDDVDRLQREELMRLLQMIRNMADFPYVYYIVAGDKEAMMNRLREAEIAEPDEYLKKFFNIEVCFPADDMQLAQIIQNGLDEICSRYSIQSLGIYNFIRQLKYGSAIFANIRDVKRFLNELDFTLTNLSANKMIDEVYMRDVAGVCMIQCIDSEFYRILRDHNEYILEYAGWNLKVKKDFADVFADRPTKKMIYEAALSIAKDDSKPTDPLKEEVESKVHSLPDLVKWSKPTKMEEIGELLDIMFPRNHVSESKVAICHPTEYFKYFSTVYKGTEISNAELIGIMQRNKASYVEEVRKIIKDGKLQAFRHKLPWYFQTHEVPRVHAIEYVMDAFALDWEATGEQVPSFKEVSFMQNYGGCLYAILRERGPIGEFNKREEWGKVSDWFITNSNYENRILVLHILAKHTEDYSSYIFGSRENVMQCVEASEKQFVEVVWSKQKYEPRLYSLIPTYFSIDTKIAEYVLEEIKKIKTISTFLYHLLKYANGDLQWNKEYIGAVLGSDLALSYEGSQWRDVLPKKWEAEFLQFNMNAPLKDEEISRSDFLKSALRYWRRVEKKDDEKIAAHR